MNALLIVLLIICMISLVLDLIMVSRILQEIQQKQVEKIKKDCVKFGGTIALGGITLGFHTLIDAIINTPAVSLSLITLKIFGSIGPFIIGGGIAICFFLRAAKGG